MVNFFRFLIHRLIAVVASLIGITMILYAGVMVTPPAARARLYLPPGKGGERATEDTIRVIIRDHHLDEPFPIQYVYWIRSLATGSWGYSPNLREDVLAALVHRTPATLELAIFSFLLSIPLGLTMGLIAGWKPHAFFDRIFQGVAFFGTSMPQFILALMLISIFYVKFGWLSPGRIGLTTSLVIMDSNFINYTGALTVDSLINLRFDIFLDSLQHLIMPAFTVSLVHWATLGRVTRTLASEQRNKEYITVVRSHGLKERHILWKHLLRTILAPALTTVAFSSASIITSIFLVEIIFGFTGVSQVIVIAMQSTPDAPATLGFAVYSVLVVIGLMFILDLVQALVDPRVRDEVFYK